MKQLNGPIALVILGAVLILGVVFYPRFMSENHDFSQIKVGKIKKINIIPLEMSPPDKINKQEKPQNKNSNTEKSKMAVQKQSSYSLTLEKQKFWFDKCYFNYLKKYPKGTGEIQAMFEITNRGQPRQIEIFRSTLGDENLEECIIDVIKRTRFKPYQGEVQKVLFPILLKP